MIRPSIDFSLVSAPKSAGLTPQALAAGLAQRFDGLAASAPAPGVDMDAAPGGMA